MSEQHRENFIVGLLFLVSIFALGLIAGGSCGKTVATKNICSAECQEHWILKESRCQCLIEVER